MLTLIALAAAQETVSCVGPTDTPACQTFNEMVGPTNDLVSNSFDLVRADQPVARLRPSSILARLESAQAAAELAGCSVNGWTGARYTGATEVAWVSSAGPGGFTASDDVGQSPILRTSSRTFEGSTDAFDAEATIGVLGSLVQSLKIWAFRGDMEGFVAGVAVREQGSRGLVFSLWGTCPGNAAEAFDEWMGGDALSGFHRKRLVFKTTTTVEPQLLGGLCSSPA